MTSLRERYDGFVCDLDGVVYRGPDPVVHAVEQLRVPGMSVVYATNNASRPPGLVADHLVRLGLTVAPQDVVTSSQAGARRISQQVPPGSSVLAVGGEGVSLALVEAGLRPVTPAQLREAAQQGDSPPVAVLQGYGPQVTADDLAWASYLVADGAWWVATNTDATLPTDRGVAPGNGMLVAAVQRASGVTPSAAGKPQGDLYDLACERLGTRVVLGVGDRLDTDILGAMAAGVDSLWVLTGVDDLVSLVTAPGRPRPTYVAADLRALGHPVPAVTRHGETWECAGWSVRRDDTDASGMEVRGPDPRSVPDQDADLSRSVGVLNAGLALLVDALETLDAPDSVGSRQRDQGAAGSGGPSADRLATLARALQEAAGAA